MWRVARVSGEIRKSELVVAAGDAPPPGCNTVRTRKWLERRRLRGRGVRYVRWNTARKRETRVGEEKSSLTPGRAQQIWRGEEEGRADPGAGQVRREVREEEARCRDTLSTSDVVLYSTLEVLSTRKTVDAGDWLAQRH